MGGSKSSSASTVRNRYSTLSQGGAVETAGGANFQNTGDIGGSVNILDGNAINRAFEFASKSLNDTFKSAEGFQNSALELAEQGIASADSARTDDSTELIKLLIYAGAGVAALFLGFKLFRK